MKKIFLSETTRPTALMCFFVASPSRPLPSLLKICPLGKIGLPRVNMFCIGLYRENMNESSCLKPGGMEP